MFLKIQITILMLLIVSGSFSQKKSVIHKYSIDTEAFQKHKDDEDFDFYSVQDYAYRNLENVGEDSYKKQKRLSRKSQTHKEYIKAKRQELRTIKNQKRIKRKFERKRYKAIKKHNKLINGAGRDPFLNEKVYKRMKKSYKTARRLNKGKNPVPFYKRIIKQY